MSKPLIYLAGPISGRTFAVGNYWRTYAAKQLAPEIKTLSPLRDKEFLSDLQEISAHGEEYKHLSPLATSRGVMTRDFYDCTRADVLLVNLLGAERVSIGTCMEIAWAFDRRIPIVCVLGADDVHGQHMMIKEAIDYPCSSLDDGIFLVRSVVGV